MLHQALSSSPMWVAYNQFHNIGHYCPQQSPMHRGGERERYQDERVGGPCTSGTSGLIACQ
ncbi:hypothetical protein BDR04DRAFT_1097531 [Suillus decipiens]|nr:hypothetical protein BDR04DRAFT_1097531 [Suillus decipiens]